MEWPNPIALDGQDDRDALGYWINETRHNTLYISPAIWCDNFVSTGRDEQSIKGIRYRTINFVNGITNTILAWFGLLWFVLLPLFVDSVYLCDKSTNIPPDCFSETGEIIWLPRCQCNTVEYRYKFSSYVQRGSLPLKLSKVHDKHIRLVQLAAQKSKDITLRPKVYTIVRILSKGQTFRPFGLGAIILIYLNGKIKMNKRSPCSWTCSNEVCLFFRVTVCYVSFWLCNSRLCPSPFH